VLIVIFHRYHIFGCFLFYQHAKTHVFDTQVSWQDRASFSISIGPIVDLVFLKFD